MNDPNSAAAQAINRHGVSSWRLTWRGALTTLALGCLIGVGWVFFRDMNQLASADHWEKHTYQVLLEMEQLMSALKDAETGQRGYLLTGREEYLAPYNEAIKAIGEHQESLLRLTIDDPSQQQRLGEIDALSRIRLRILKQTIDLRRTQGFGAALAMVQSGQGKTVMDQIRGQVAAAEAEEQRLLSQRSGDKISRVNQTTWTLTLFGISGASLLLGILFLLQREIADRKRVANELKQHRDHLEDVVRIRTEALDASRQRFAGIVESAMDAIITIDAGQRIVLFNRAAESMFQYPADQALGHSVERFIPLRFQGDHSGHIELFSRTGSTTRTMGKLGAIYGLRADGTEFPIEASISQIEVQGKKLYTVILRDITARVAAEGEIRRMNAELEERVEARTAELQEANQELDNYASAVSHDLRAPLRAINGFARILGADYKDQLDEAGRQYLEKILGGVQRMGELIDGLLQLSRCTRSELICRPVDLSELAHRILSEIAALDPGRKVHCQIEEGLEAEGDPRMLEALMRNLLDNAWKYTARTVNPEIRFYADHSCDPPHFCVADNGAGFDMAHADQLFQPFRRLHRQGEFAGIGIGLATVRRIVHRHGGEIKAQAAPGAGASFYFTLPGGVAVST